MTNEIRNWMLERLEENRNSPRVLVLDPLQLLKEPQHDSQIEAFALKYKFAVIVASTNLAFRMLYERTLADPAIKKILMIDRAPASRRKKSSVLKAPPPFYPDLLNDTPSEARIHLDLRQFLKERTGDPNWPQEVNNPRYARLIVRNLGAVLRAHQNLRIANKSRFTDYDFKTIVAYAALGVADSAFKRMDAEDYWKIGLLGYEALEKLELLAPEVTNPIKDELRKAPAPFCHFVNQDPELVIRVFYLALILAQHTRQWSLLLGNIDPAFQPLANIKPEILKESAPKLIALNREQAEEDLESVERSLPRAMLQLVLLDQLKLSEPQGFTAVVEKERYSTLFRSLALLLALEHLLSTENVTTYSKKCLTELNERQARFVEIRYSLTWSQLKEAYTLASEIQRLKNEFTNSLKSLNVLKTDQLSFEFFRSLWNEKKINRLEYYVSALERLVDSGSLLPRPEDELPSVFSNALAGIRQHVRKLSDTVHRQLDDVNCRFQEMVAHQYPSWISRDTEVRLTSQFLRRCLKPYWDPQREKAVVFIFDGMRYDIWDELLRPMLEDRMEVLADLPAASLLPSETQITRKALSAGTYPDTFDPRDGEDKLLKDGLAREFGYTGDVTVVPPDGTGTGETVRYRAGNLDVYIFELCDKELHNIHIKKLPDGREVPSRPLTFIYQQHLKNIIDTEVMAIIRGLAPGTKVFITADHGFGRVGREPLWFAEHSLHKSSDCKYLHCKLKVSADHASLPGKVRKNVIVFTPEQLRMPRTIRGASGESYQAIVFPKVGYSFSRPGAPYNPDVYTHGGISVQELLIPMVVLQVKSRDEGLLSLEAIEGPTEVHQGEEVEFRLSLNRNVPRGGKPEELRVDIEAAYSRDPERFPLPPKTLFIMSRREEVSYHFRLDVEEATAAELRQGSMTRTLTITVSYREGRKTRRLSRTHRFNVRLNPESIVRRVHPELGNILGLTPKSMR